MAENVTIMVLGCVCHEAAFRIALVGLETRIIDVKRRAVRAEDLAVLAHVEIDVRMIEGRAGAHAIELPNTDEDTFGTRVVREVRCRYSSHAMPFQET